MNFQSANRVVISQVGIKVYVILIFQRIKCIFLTYTIHYITFEKGFPTLPKTTNLTAVDPTFSIYLLLILNTL